MWNPSTCDCECKEACRIDKYLDIKNCSFEKHVFNILVLSYEDEVLNTTETSVNDKSNCLIHAISLVIISSVIISCHFCWLLLELHKTLEKAKTFNTKSLQ